MKEKKKHLLSDEDFSNDFHKIDQLEKRTKGEENKNSEEELLKDFTEKFVHDRIDVDNNFL